MIFDALALAYFSAHMTALWYILKRFDAWLRARTDFRAASVLTEVRRNVA